MVMKYTTLCLAALAMFGCLCDAQKPIQKPSHPQKPALPPQTKQTFEKPLTWKYPEDPKPDPKIEVDFQMKYPVAASTVAVECRERDARVEVKRDLFGIGQPINPADLTLGKCPAIAEDTVAQVLIFESDLHECGSSSMTLEDALVYSFVLNYYPTPLGESPVVRTSKAAIIVECYYPRKQNVSSSGIQPWWIPYSAVKVAQEFLYFTLTLMTDDWLYERPSNQYNLGDIINIEATVKQYFHVPLRVYMQHCVATVLPDPDSIPRYAFIETGCLLDGIVTGSASRFIRKVDNILQLQLEAFRFESSDVGLIYITCHLTATSSFYAIDEDHRACYYDNGWKEASGADYACNTCPAVVPPKGIGVINTGGSWNPSKTKTQIYDRKVRDVSKTDVVWEGVVTLGPIPIGEPIA
ncbi:zona pellucida sperm-binding protein 3-like isoform X2 [Takifugu flavidus]|uniref:zona pellucida sperm-binding protein 3-like isoform X2 n=1 Tax=Takifugu flavidus TaxID=433684 RepID=UPI002544603A|nr:zona pellucida sperm-binding protein 3-like isoform X2 [Takifugu flavidus]